MLAENPLLVNEWVDMLRPVGRSLLGPLADVSAGLSDRGARRLATSILADYASADPEQLVDLIVNADPEQFAVFLPGVASHRDVAIPILQEPRAGGHPNLPTRRGSDPSEKEADTLARHRATAAVALLRLGLPDVVWPLLAFSPDPRVQTETIQALVHLGAAPDLLAERVLREPDASARAALLLALADCALQAPDQAWVGRILPHVLDTYRNDPDPGVHGAARLLLRRMGRSRDVRQIDDGFGRRGRPRPTSLVRRWGKHDGRDRPDRPRHEPSPPAGRSTESSRSRARKQRWSSSSVSAPHHPYKKALGTDLENPGRSRQLVRRGGLLHWLDEESHVPVNERCYPPVDQITEGMQISRDYLSRTGHRLPTSAEWEYAARALTTTSRCYGDRDGLLAEYAWFSGNSGDILHLVGSLKPNAMGLFDVYGSMLEWCQESMAF